MAAVTPWVGYITEGEGREERKRESMGKVGESKGRVERVKKGGRVRKGRKDGEGRKRD